MPLDRKSKYGFVTENDEEELRDKLLDETTLYQPRVLLPEPTPLNPGELSLDMGTQPQPEPQPEGAAGGQAGGQAPVVAPQDPIQEETPVAKPVAAPTDEADPGLSNRQMGMMAGGFEKINAAFSGQKPAGTAAKPYYDAADDQQALLAKAKVNPLDPNKDPTSPESRRMQAAFKHVFRGFMPDAQVDQMSAAELKVWSPAGTKDVDRDARWAQFEAKQNLENEKLAFAQATTARKFKQTEDAMMKTMSRYAGTAAKDYSKSLSTMRPVVAALATIDDIDPAFLRGHVAPNEDVYMLWERIKNNNLPAGVGTHLSERQQTRLNSAALMLYQAYIRPLAGANLTPQEQTKMDEILRTRLLDSPAAAAAIVDMIRTQKHQELKQMEAGVRTQLEETGNGHVWDAYVAQGGLSSGDPVFRGLDEIASDPDQSATPVPNVQTQVTDPTPDQLGALEQQPVGSQIRVAPKVAPKPVQQPKAQPKVGSILTLNGQKFRVIDEAGNTEPVQ